MCVDFAKQTKVTPRCKLGNVKSLYQHGMNGTVQQVHRSYRTMQPIHAYDVVMTHQQQAKETITKFIMVQSPMTRQQSPRTTTRHSPVMRGTQG
jgi:hypothetical protein